MRWDMELYSVGATRRNREPHAESWSPDVGRRRMLQECSPLAPVYIVRKNIRMGPKEAEKCSAA